MAILAHPADSVDFDVGINGGKDGSGQLGVAAAPDSVGKFSPQALKFCSSALKTTCLLRLTTFTKGNRIVTFL